MSKILKYMKNYWVGTLVVFVLLIVQAYCDLALPNYTADILDTGIMQKGVQNICPQVVSEKSMNGVMLFMTEDEKNEVLDNYVLRDSLKDCDIQMADNAPDGAVYELNTKDSDTIEKLDDDFGMAVMAYSAVSQMTTEDMQKMSGNKDTSSQEMSAEAMAKLAEMQKNGEEITVMSMISAGVMDGIEIRNQIEDKYSSMSDMAVSQAAKAYWQSEYENIGVDMKAFQKSYLFMQGGKMLGMAALIMVCTIIICYLAAKIGAGVGKDLRVGVFRRVVSFSNAEMDNFSTSSLITRSTNDIQQIQMVLTIMLRMCLYAPILGVGGLIKVLNTNTSMVWIIALAVVLVLIVVGILMMTAMPKFKIMQHFRGKHLWR